MDLMVFVDFFLNMHKQVQMRRTIITTSIIMIKTIVVFEELSGSLSVSIVLSTAVEVVSIFGSEQSTKSESLEPNGQNCKLSGDEMQYLMAWE